MYLKFSVCLITLLLVYGSVSSQDRITLMHYNLLYYGKHTDFCDASNNALTGKQQHLKKILKYVQPDILTVNELDGNASLPHENDAVHLLDHTLNVDGVSRYRKTPFNKTYLANTVFYNANKLKFHSWHSIPLFVGDYEKMFNAYTFYYHAANIDQSTDTTFLTCFVVHLKSGNNDSDAMQRADEAEILTDYIDNEMPDSGNYIICGDLNVYGSDEKAFQILTKAGTAGQGFYDPLNLPGNWHNSEKYKLYHTQSTHTGGSCFSAGGMDDRFDFILLSGAIMDSAKSVKYVKESYTTIGQDGKGYNASLNTTTNEAVPKEIAEALYHFSDHLPVTVQLEIDGEPAITLLYDSIFHQPAKPLAEDSVTIYTQLTDTEGAISSVRLRWGNQSQHLSRQSEMMLTGNFYSTSIKGPEEPSAIYYQVEARDSSGEALLESKEKKIVFEKDTLANISFGETLNIKITNPVKEHLALHLPENFSEDLVVSIVDLTGRARLNQRYSGYCGKLLSIPVSFLQPGIYWIRIQHNGILKMNKFIKL